MWFCVIVLIVVVCLLYQENKTVKKELQNENTTNSLLKETIELYENLYQADQIKLEPFQYEENEENDINNDTEFENNYFVEEEIPENSGNVLDEAVKKHLKEHLSDYLYFEGKDYYFRSQNPLNNNLTIYTKSVPFRLIKENVWRSLHDVFKDDYHLSDYGEINLQSSVFHIPVLLRSIEICKGLIKQGFYEYSIMEPNVLEEAIKKDPERWEMFKKSKGL